MSNEVIVFIVSAYGILMAFDKTIDVVLKYKNRAEAPEARLRSVENEIEKIKGFLAHDKQRLDANDRGQSILQKSILALIDNAIDGTDKAPLYKAKEDLHNFLIEKQIEG